MAKVSGFAGSYREVANALLLKGYVITSLEASPEAYRAIGSGKSGVNGPNGVPVSINRHWRGKRAKFTFHDKGNGVPMFREVKE